MQQEIILVMFGSTRQSGKSEAARHLAYHLRRKRQNVVELSFGNCIKQEVAQFMRHCKIEIPNPLFHEVKDKILRPIWNEWGRKRREQDPKYQVRETLLYLRAPIFHRKKKLYVIIDDWRDVQEFYWTDQFLTGMNFKVTATFPFHMERNSSEPFPNERPLRRGCRALAEKYGTVVHNNGSQAALVEYVRKELLQRVMKSGK